MPAGPRSRLPLATRLKLAVVSGASFFVTAACSLVHLRPTPTPTVLCYEATRPPEDLTPTPTPPMVMCYTLPPPSPMATPTATPEITLCYIAQPVTATPTATPTAEPTPEILCYAPPPPAVTETPAPVCYTPTPAVTLPSAAAALPVPVTRDRLLQRFRATGRWPQAVLAILETAQED